MPFAAVSIHTVDTCGVSLYCKEHNHKIRYLRIERFTDCGTDYAIHTLCCVDCIQEEELKNNLTTPNMKINVWPV